MVEMTLAVALAAGMTATSIEWSAWHLGQEQAVRAQRQLSALAHLIRTYAQDQHKAYGIGTVYEKGIPPNGLMQDRWPDSLADLVSPRYIPSALAPCIHLPAVLVPKSANTSAADCLQDAPGGWGWRLLGSEDLTITPVRRMGAALLRLDNIPSEYLTSARRAAVLLRRQGLPTRYWQGEGAGGGMVGRLTVVLLPLDDVFNKRFIGTTGGQTIVRNVRILFKEGGGLAVGALQADEVSAHTAVLSNSDAPLDFSYETTDQAYTHSREYFGLGQWGNDSQIQAGWRLLGGYSGFFKGPCEEWIGGREYGASEIDRGLLHGDEVQYWIGRSRESKLRDNLAFPFQCSMYSGMRSSSRLYSRFGYAVRDVPPGWWDKDVDKASLRLADSSLSSKSASRKTNPNNAAHELFNWAQWPSAPNSLVPDSENLFSGSYVSNALISSANMPHINNYNLFFEPYLREENKTAQGYYTIPTARNECISHDYKHAKETVGQSGVNVTEDASRRNVISWLLIDLDEPSLIREHENSRLDRSEDCDAVGRWSYQRKRNWALTLVPIADPPRYNSTGVAPASEVEALMDSSVTVGRLSGVQRKNLGSNWINRVLHDLGGGAREGCYSTLVRAFPYWHKNWADGDVEIRGDAPLFKDATSPPERVHFYQNDSYSVLRAGADMMDECQELARGKRSYWAKQKRKDNKNRQSPPFDQHYLYVPVRVMMAPGIRNVAGDNRIQYDGGLVHSFGGQLPYTKKDIPGFDASRPGDCIAPPARLSRLDDCWYTNLHLEQVEQDLKGTGDLHWGTDWIHSARGLPATADSYTSHITVPAPAGRDNFGDGTSKWYSWLNNIRPGYNSGGTAACAYSSSSTGCEIANPLRPHLQYDTSVISAHLAKTATWLPERWDWGK